MAAEIVQPPRTKFHRSEDWKKACRLAHARAYVLTAKAQPVLKMLTSGHRYMAHSAAVFIHKVLRRIEVVMDPTDAHFRREEFECFGLMMPSAVSPIYARAVEQQAKRIYQLEAEWNARNSYEIESKWTEVDATTQSLQAYIALELADGGIHPKALKKKPKSKSIDDPWRWTADIKHVLDTVCRRNPRETRVAAIPRTDPSDVKMPEQNAGADEKMSSSRSSSAPTHATNAKTPQIDAKLAEKTASSSSSSAPAPPQTDAKLVDPYFVYVMFSVHPDVKGTRRDYHVGMTGRTVEECIKNHNYSEHAPWYLLFQVDNLPTQSKARRLRDRLESARVESGGQTLEAIILRLIFTASDDEWSNPPLEITINSTSPIAAAVSDLFRSAQQKYNSTQLLTA
jgi:hypothetical protein